MTSEREWVRSSYSGGQGGNCIEVAARRAERVVVRDSKDAQGPVLRFPREAWQVFTMGIKG
jgi:hypothetical protein